MTLTHFQEPSFPVGVEERQRQVVPVVLRELQRLVADAGVEFLEDRGQGMTGRSRGGVKGRGREANRPLAALWEGPLRC